MGILDREPNKAERRKAAIEACWRAGDLEAVAMAGKPLHPGQRELLAAFKEFKGRTFVVNTSRRWGKSIWSVTLAAEAALSGKRVLLAADTQKHIRDIVQPHMDMLLTTCPEDIRPRWDNLASAYRFGKKGTIRLVGLDAGQADRARGTAEDLVVIDEAGFAAELEYFVNSVVLPTLITTGGKLVAISTPSVSVGHYFRDMCQAAKTTGSYNERNIYDACLPQGHLKPSRVEEFKEDYDRRYGPDSTPWRREYMCEFVTEAERAVIPEFTRHRSSVVLEHERPEFFEPYVAIDMGYSDLTVALFGYWDFRAGMLIIEDEAIARQAVPYDIAKTVGKKEEELWPTASVRVQRFVDAPPIILAEFNMHHALKVSAITKRKAGDKPFKEAALANLRESIQDHTIRIHPRCKTLIAHLEAAIWNASRSSYERPRENVFSGDTPLGHFDALDAAIYLNWMVAKHRDPYPKYERGLSAEDHMIRPIGGKGSLSDTGEKLKAAFRPRLGGRKR